MIKGGMKQIIRGMFDSEQVGDAAANRARIAAMQKKEAAEAAAEKAAKDAKKAAEGKTARQADPQINPNEVRRKEKMKDPKFRKKRAEALAASDAKEKVAEKVTQSPTTPSSQKRMRLPAKGETTKRKKGGKVKKTTIRKRANFSGKGAGVALRGF
tara:strand:+ start:49 stop:516 length:468 start_codon:yes stop_codon:yes gene_type:complete